MEIELGSEYVGIPVVRSPFVDNSEGSGRTGITPSDIAYCSNDVRAISEHQRFTRSRGWVRKRGSLRMLHAK